MTEWTFPRGAAALHPDWPDARFNVSGMFSQHLMVLHLLDLVKRGYDCQAPIEAIHGSPAVPWNAGRVADQPFDPALFDQILDELAARNIGYFPTFTNHLITEDELQHPIGNHILARISQRPDLNGVIIASELLSDYVARKYPRLRQIASVVKVTLEHGQGQAEYYARLGQRFFRYVVHPDDCRNPKLLAQLDREKAEILANENCVADCPRRQLHYTAYAKMQKASTDVQRQAVQNEIDQIVTGCRSIRSPHSIGDQARSCNLTRSEMKAAYDLGFRHFKLQGRADDPWSYAYDLTRYMLEPEFVAPRVYKWLCNWLPTVVVLRAP